MHHEIRTEIDIEAPPEAVWNVLVDLTAYAEWNPFIVSAEGNVEVGQELDNRLRRPNGRTMRFTPTVTKVAPAEVFEWLGRLWMPRIFDGRHRFELHTTPAGTHVQHSETFQGALVRPLRASLDRDTRAGFEAMNVELKRRVENR